MKRLLLVTAAAVAVFVSGCANTEYLKAQADAAIAAGNARVAEAQAASDEAKAVIALAAKIDAGGATAYLVAKAMKGMGAPQVQTVAIQRPRDFLDYLAGITSTVSALGSIAVPIVTVQENGRIQRAGYDRDVAIEQARQVGETGRISSVAQIAQSVAAGRPNTTINVGRDATLGGNQANNNSATDRHDGHTCPGGSGASGGAGGGTDAGGAGGGAGSGGGATGGTC